MRTDFANNQSSATLILSLPNNRQFLSGSCTPYIVNNVDMTAVSYSRTNTTLTLYITTDSFANNGLDSLRWSGCQVQSIDGSKL